ncbi:hypothetical protein ACHAXH_006687, partial [Discostella pseudostelligera]
AIASRCPCHSHCIAARRRDRHATWYEQLPLNHLDIMSVLLETTFGDLVLDLDVDGSPALCKNILKLAKARYYTNTLIYNIVPGKYCQMGDPSGDGTGGCTIYGLIDSYQTSMAASGNKNSNNQRPKQITPDVTKSQRRFLQSHGRNLSPDELNRKGLIIAMEMANLPHTIGSQFLLTLSDTNGLRNLISTANKVDNGGNDCTDKQNNTAIRYLSLGTVVEDSQNILSKLNRAYCDDNGRPYADIRIQRALVIHDPFEDPVGMEDLLRWRGVECNWGEVGEGDIRDDDLMEGYPLAPQSPAYDRPIEEIVPTRIQADDTTLFATAGWDDNNASNEYDDEEEEDEAARQHRLELQEKQEAEWRKRQESSKAVLLEMLGDRPTADIQAPENVLFVCKLNPFTNDEDLELIFSRFDSRAKAEIIRDPDTGASLQYAFVEFTTNEACNEAYLKMNNALVDDRRIRVDFSQSVAKVWDRYHRKYRMGDRSGVDRGFVDGGQSNSGRGRGRGNGREHGDRRGRGPGHWNSTKSNVPGRNSDQFGYGNKGQQQPQQHQPAANDNRSEEDSEFDSFGRVVRSRDANEKYHSQQSENGNGSISGSHRPRDNNRSHNQSRDRAHDARRGVGSGSRNDDRRSRSPCSDSSDSGRRKKKHHKHRRKDSSRRKRSRSRERERKAKKHHRHRHRDYSSSEDDETHVKSVDHTIEIMTNIGDAMKGLILDNL